MKRVLYFPGRYIQGPGVIEEIGHYATSLGDCAFAVGGKTALSICGAAMESSLAARGSATTKTFSAVSPRAERSTGWRSSPAPRVPTSSSQWAAGPPSMRPRQILRHLKLATEPPPIAEARACQAPLAWTSP
jgi:hypothetical protein